MFDLACYSFVKNISGVLWVSIHPLFLIIYFRCSFRECRSGCCPTQANQYIPPPAIVTGPQDICTLTGRLNTDTS